MMGEKLSVKSTKFKYGTLAILFHYINVIAVIGLLISGIVMTGNIDDLSKVGMYRAHVAIGLLVALIVTLRVIWALFDSSPNPPDHTTRYRLIIYKAVHYLIYGLITVLIVSGISILIASGLGITPRYVIPDKIISALPPLTIHVVFLKLLILLLLVHIAGVLSYQFLKGDVLSRIGIPWFKRK